MKNKKGFTLVELVVVFVITTFVISGLMFFFGDIVSSSNPIYYSYDMFSKIETIDKKLEEYGDKYLYNDYAFPIPSEKNYGFSLVLYKDDPTNPKSGALVGVFDTTNNILVKGDITDFYDYKVFSKELSEAEILLLKNNPTSFIQSLNVDNINIISELNVVKFGISNLSGKSKIDIGMIPFYEKYFLGKTFGDLEKEETFEKNYISILR